MPIDALRRLAPGLLLACLSGLAVLAVERVLRAEPGTLWLFVAGLAVTHWLL